MKAIILISSIFYILGLKVSHTIDVVKRSNPADKIISSTPILNTEQSKSITLQEGQKIANSKDSLLNRILIKNRLQEVK